MPQSGKQGHTLFFARSLHLRSEELPWMTPSQTSLTPRPGECLVATVEARTSAISRAMDRYVPTLLATATAGVVIKVLVAG